MTLTPEQRAYHRRRAAAQRAARLARLNETATHCRQRHGPGVCGGQLEDRRDAMTGRIYRWCPRCDRRRRGVCQDCPRPVAGRIGYAMRCVEHKELARRESIRRSDDRHREEYNARARARASAMTPAEKEKHLAYKRAWRRLHPDKVKEQKRREALRQGKKRLDWHRRYNASRRAAKAAAMKAQYRANNPIPSPTCTKCKRAIPWIGRTDGGGRPPKTCVFCMDKNQLRYAALRWAFRTDQEIANPPTPAPRVRPWKPKQPTRFNAQGQRLCLSPDCETVMTGTRKKCDACQIEAMREAEQLLERRRGRGRRTDLEAAA